MMSVKHVLETGLWLAALALLAALLAPGLASGEEETIVVHPSVEELAVPPPPLQITVETGTADSICLMIESAARENGLPLEYFARVIWQESRFQVDAIGPTTRYGTRAQGIAQFMPGTASERGLLDPFNPVKALPKAAEFLAELRSQFGNLGLAAAAYNAGPRRVQEWLAGTGGNPQLCPGHHRLSGRRLGQGRQGRQDARERAADHLPGSDGAAQAGAESLRRPA
jgi:hypothetical protein